jgi:hypothetical protein
MSALTSLVRGWDSPYANCNTTKLSRNEQLSILENLKNLAKLASKASKSIKNYLLAWIDAGIVGDQLDLLVLVKSNKSIKRTNLDCLLRTVLVRTAL